MQYLGETISLAVAMLWTISALAAEVGSKRLGVFVMNVWRMGLALIFSALFTKPGFSCVSHFLTKQ